MTNSSKSYALESLALCAALALAGCGGKVDPAQEFAAGKAAFDLRDWKSASQHYRKGLESAPGDVDSLMMLARCDLAAGEVDAAAESVAKAAETNGDDADVIELGAQIAFYRKEYDTAAKAYERLANDESRDLPTRATGWAGLGVVDYIQIGLNPSRDELRDKARTELLRATQLDKHNASARYHLGRLYRDSFNFIEAAKEQFDFFVHLQKDVVDERVQRVQREMLPALRDAIAKKAASRPGASKRDTVGCAASLSKADAFLRKHNGKAAIAAYEDALKKDPLSYPAARGLAKTREAVDKTKEGQKEALKAYRVACELSPGDVKTHIAAGDLAMKLDSSSTAAVLYSRAVAANPADITAVDGLIRALRKSGKAKSAAVYQRYRDTIPRRKK